MNAQPTTAPATTAAGWITRCYISAKAHYVTGVSRSATAAPVTVTSICGKASYRATAASLFRLNGEATQYGGVCPECRRLAAQTA